MNKKELSWFLVFSIVVFAFIFSLAPANLPLNDDIIYFQSVKNFVENGSLVNNEPYIVSLVVQILYGSLFASIFGLSYSTLMLSMMLVSCFTVIATYFLLRTKLDIKYSILGSLILLTNPIFFNLTHTFMTDPLALFFMITSATWFIKFSERKKYSYFLIGLFLSIAGFWVRQYTIMTVASLFLYLLLKDRQTLFTKKIIIPIIIIPLVSILSWGYWFYVLHDQSYVCPYTLGYGTNFAKNVAQLFIYHGYFLFPLSFLFLLNFKKISIWIKEIGIYKSAISISVLIIVILFILIRSYLGFNINPFDKSLAESRGVGAYTISGDKSPFLPGFFWAPIIILSFIVTFSLSIMYFRNLKQNSLIILTELCLALPMLFYVAFYDRYYLFLLPFSLLILLPELKNFKYTKQIIIIAIVLMGIWGWYGTYDYLSWNKARWDGINYLLHSDVDPKEIDGGLEYDARFFEKCTDRSAAVRWHGWAYSISDKYVISFSKLSGYETIKEMSYFGPLGEKRGSIFIERKK